MQKLGGGKRQKEENVNHSNEKELVACDDVALSSAFVGFDAALEAVELQEQTKEYLEELAFQAAALSFPGSKAALKCVENLSTVHQLSKPLEEGISLRRWSDCNLLQNK